jgi:hypothetical protein
MEGWHLDKRVPLGLLAGLIFQTLMVGWWLSSVESRITVLERADTLYASSRAVNLQRLGSVETTAQVLTVQGADVRERLNRIENKLDKVIEEQGGDIP